MQHNTPKKFILQLGSLIALYISVTSLLILIFNVTNLRFPDEASYYWESENAREAVRNSIAMLIVFFPTYFIFTRLSNQDRRKYSQGEYTSFAKWLVYISILGGILILLADMVALIIYFLNGEITTRFAVKVFALLAVVGATLHYYILDVRGYFKKRVDISLYFATGATVVVISSLLFGFSYIETPTEVREMRLDEQQVTDLQNIYWNITEYNRVYKELPDSIEQAFPQTDAPDAPDGRPEYRYKKIDTQVFELCATFAFPSRDKGTDISKPVPAFYPEDPSPYQNQNWDHKDGEVCFKRSVGTKTEEGTVR